VRLLTLRKSTERYGAEEHVLRVAVGAAREGWEVHAAFPKTPGTESMIRDCSANAVSFHPFSYFNPERRSFWSRNVLARGFTALHAGYRMSRLIWSVRPDVIQLTVGWGFETPQLVIVCALMQIPTMVVFQTAPAPISTRTLNAWAYVWARKRGQCWVAVSHHNRKSICDSLDWAPDAVRVIHNGTELESSLSLCSDQESDQIRREVRAELRIPPEAKLLLTVGRLEQEKGFLDLLAAVPTLVRNNREIRFVWVGDGGLKDLLTKRIRAEGLDNLVLLTGYRSDVLRLMKAADLLVVASRFEGGCSSVIREAMVLCLPIVATDAGGIPEVVEHQTHGFLYPVGDTGAMIESIEWSLGHGKEMKLMAIEAKKRISSFSANRMVEDYLAAFRTIAETPGLA